MSQENTANQNDVMLLTRRQRRYMLKQNGILKRISKLSFFNPTRTAIRNQNIEQGKKLHEQHMDVQEQRTAARLETILENCKATWRVSGYNDQEIALLEEAWSLTVIKDRETYRADKKRSRELTRQAEQLRVERTK